MPVEPIKAAQVRVSQAAKKDEENKISQTPPEADAVKVSLTRTTELQDETAAKKKAEIKIDALKKDVSPTVEDNDRNSDLAKAIHRDEVEAQEKQRHANREQQLEKEQKVVERREYLKGLKAQDKADDKKAQEKIEALDVSA